MDIAKGSLDKVSRPVSSSRAYPSCRALNTSVELPTPEPRSPEVILLTCRGLEAAPHSSW